MDEGVDGENMEMNFWISCYVGVGRWVCVCEGWEVEFFWEVGKKVINRLFSDI